MKQLALSYLVFAGLFGFISSSSYARVFPEEGMVLNYRIVGFSFPSLQEVSGYKIEIAAGNILDQDRFDPIVISTRSRNNHIIATVPQFGAGYTWRIVYIDDKNKTSKSDLFHFSTGNTPQVDTLQTRLHVTQKYKTSQFYVIADGSNVMYDMEGKPVWYLPQIDSEPVWVTDIKCTQQHTLTFLRGRDGVETDYNGKTLWKTPDIKPGADGTGSSVIGISLHHEFSRLANGHYMALGSELRRPVADAVTKKASDFGKNNIIGPKHFFPANRSGVLYEFDAAGNIIWSWRSEDYFVSAGISPFYRYIFKILMAKGVTSHENSFCFDEKKQVIYLSYASFNCVIKLSYPSGKVLNAYGLTDNNRSISDSFLLNRIPVNELIKDYIMKNGLFSGQHCCRITRDGSLMLYNNNIHDTALPEVEIFREQDTGVLKVVWRYQCPGYSGHGSLENEGGGSEYELQDGSLFVSMNFPYGSLFIVNRGHKMLWNALLERKNSHNEWDPIQSYRSAILSQSDLEELIWASEGANVAESTKAKLSPDKHHSTFISN